MNLLRIPIVHDTRRNHGLEHATIHVLAERHVPRALAGYSTPAGFLIVGDVRADELRAAVDEALRRLRAGQKHLAVHPGCGTNYATSGFVAGALVLASASAGGRRQSRLDQLSNAAFAATIGILIGQILGRWLQANVTTSGEMGGMNVREVRQVLLSPVKAHWVATAPAP
jgi:hypothetical protein